MSEFTLHPKSPQESEELRKALLADWYNYEGHDQPPAAGEIDHWLHQLQDGLQARPTKELQS